MINAAIDAAGGAANLAAAIGVSSNLPSMWKRRGQIPIRHCAQIEALTKGAVTRKDLRPDDWHLIWPELVAPVEVSHG